MFDPIVGVWLEEDPIGFDGGDPNLRRYVGNNGINATDRNGLAEKEVGPPPREVEIGPMPKLLTPSQARGYKFQFDPLGSTEVELPNDGKVELSKGLVGTVKVTTSLDVLYSEHNPMGERKWIQFQGGIQIELNAPKNAEEYRWLQVVTRIPYDNKGVAKKGTYPASRPEGIIHKFGDLHVDTLSSYSPFADEETLGERNDTRSMIYDRASLRDNERLIFDKYLISTKDGRPVYAIHWELWGTANGDSVVRNFENVSGKPIKVLPLSLSSLRLPAGYSQTGEPNMLINPVESKFFHPLSSEGLRLKIK